LNDQRPLILAVYLGTAAILGWLPRLLRWGRGLQEAWEVQEAEPNRRRMLKTYPYLTGVFGAILVGGLVFALIRDSQASAWLAHLFGVSYGVLLLVDACFAWFTGIVVLPSCLRRRHAIETPRTWRSTLQLGLCTAYVLVATGLLLAALCA
jgi:hypothetical protein